MNKYFQRLKEEFLGIVPTAIFFFVAFQLLSITRSLILQHYGIQVSAFVGATIGSLIVAKVVMIVDLLPFVNRFPDKPLAYNIVWKTVIYQFAAFVVRYVEHLIKFIRKYDDISVANSHLLDEVSWPHFWVIQLWLFVILLIYCALRELIRVIGRERVHSMFFGPVRSDTT